MSKSAQHNALKKHFCERNYLYINDVIITDADSEFVKTFSIPAFSKDGIFDIFVSKNLKRYIMDHKDADHPSAEAVIYGLIGENDEMKKEIKRLNREG